MLNNYPPGVTGHELEIAGYDDETTEYRACGEYADVVVLTPLAKRRLKQARGLLDDLLVWAKESGQQRPESALVRITALLASMEAQTMEIALDECPFDGKVDVGWYQGKGDWTCPLCDAPHEDYADDGFDG